MSTNYCPHGVPNDDFDGCAQCQDDYDFRFRRGEYAESYEEYLEREARWKAQRAASEVMP